ncbi:MAG: hypothetical protein PHC46_00235 [Clostridia bacterium]|nr:hypothetical protein [Clostridia bacterium]
MNKKQLIKQLNIELNSLPIPDVIDKVRQKSDIVVMSNQLAKAKASKRSLVFRLVPAVMAFVLIAFVMFNALMPNLESAYTTLTLDINPSIELTLNSDAIVVGATGINDDGATFLAGLTLPGLNYNLALNAVLTKAQNDGYLQNSFENAIMLSVKNKNKNVENAYKNNLQAMVNTYLNSNGLNGNIIVEEYDEEAIEEFNALKQHFEQNINVTPAKYCYIKKIINRFPTLLGHEEYLASMNMMELYKLLNAEASSVAVTEIINRIINNIAGPPYGQNAGGNN